MSLLLSLVNSGCFFSSARHHTLARPVCTLSGPSTHWSPELSPLTQPMNGSGSPSSWHHFPNQLVPAQFRWNCPKLLNTSSPIDVGQAPSTFVQSASRCHKRPLVRRSR